MLEKYQNLIRSKIYRFNIYYSQREDFYQEGCLVLLEAIHKFDAKKLPSGIIHGDLFIDNIFFNKNKLSGIIDLIAPWQSNLQQR